ncbi:hypothetical protein [Streptomyces sp. SD15]
MSGRWSPLPGEHRARLVLSRGAPHGGAFTPGRLHATFIPSAPNTRFTGARKDGSPVRQESYVDARVGGIALSYNNIDAADAFVNAARSDAWTQLMPALHGPRALEDQRLLCCVVPGLDFARRFDRAPDELPQVIRAIAAQMRWSGRHFMPHAGGASDHPSFEDRDWFYASTMPDMTEWTSHHHQGHVANGVRHAIRVPVGLTLAGAHRPGLHDFRLMRTDGDVYGIQELRGHRYRPGFAGRLPGVCEPVGADRTGPALVVSDFGNTWYQQRYVPAAAVL